MNCVWRSQAYGKSCASDHELFRCWDDRERDQWKIWKRTNCCCDRNRTGKGFCWKCLCPSSVCQRQCAGPGSSSNGRNDIVGPTVYLHWLTIDFNTYILFPKMACAEDQSPHLSNEQQELCVSRIVLPALRDACPTHVRQHHPRSWAEAYSKATCLRAESVRGTNAGGPGRYVFDLYYHVLKDCLRRFWDGVLSHLYLGIRICPPVQDTILYLGIRIYLPGLGLGLTSASPGRFPARLDLDVITMQGPPPPSKSSSHSNSRPPPSSSQVSSLGSLSEGAIARQPSHHMAPINQADFQKSHLIAVLSHIRLVTGRMPNS